MATVEEYIGTITGWLRALIDFGLVLALVFLVVDILFAQPIGIVDMLVDVINVFVDNGVVGLIALLVLIGIYTK